CRHQNSQNVVGWHVALGRRVVNESLKKCGAGPDRDQRPGDLKIIFVVDIEPRDLMFDNWPDAIAHIGWSALEPESVSENIEIEWLVATRIFVAAHDRPAAVPLW